MRFNQCVLTQRSPFHFWNERDYPTVDTYIQRLEQDAHGNRAVIDRCAQQFHVARSTNVYHTALRNNFDTFESYLSSEPLSFQLASHYAVSPWEVQGRISNLRSSIRSNFEERRQVSPSIPIYYPAIGGAVIGGGVAAFFAADYMSGLSLLGPIVAGGLLCGALAVGFWYILSHNSD